MDGALHFTNAPYKPGLTQKGTKVGVIHELPLRKNKVFSHILRKSYKLQTNYLSTSTKEPPNAEEPPTRLPLKSKILILALSGLLGEYAAAHIFHKP
jgi:hypothetical protein